jgi:hypothetical protein
LAAVCAAALAGCGLFPAGGNRAGLQIPDGKMLHVQQVLDHYDAGGNPVPQYLELWLAKDTGRCSELDADGNELDVALDTGSDHLYYDAATLKAEKSKDSRLFIVNYEAMRKLYPNVESSGAGTYAGRECLFYMLGNGKPDEWMKLYVDKQTGYVLLCDAETFRLRTALIEAVPADAALLKAPDGLDFTGGDGK